MVISIALPRQLPVKQQKQRNKKTEKPNIREMSNYKLRKFLKQKCYWKKKSYITLNKTEESKHAG